MAQNDPAVNEEWNCDKGRWAFQYAETPARLQLPMVRVDGELRVASWREALEAAADGLRAASGVGVLTGGRLSAEDAYAYSKFARAVLGTNDIDFRARPHSAEEADFLASHVVATGPSDAPGGAVTYADLESAKTVVLAGFEPEDESPIVFLRLRKATRRNKTVVYAVSPVATRGLEKVSGHLIPTAPGTEPEVLDALGKGSASGAAGEGPDMVRNAAEALRAEGAILLVGERLATVPGALSAAARLAETTGARLAWVPRRAGERGALEAGALPTLLPGGRPVADAAARAEVATAWQLDGLPDAPGRDAAAILEAARSGELGALVVGGVDPLDLGRADALAAFEAPFVVSLEIRESAVTAVADVVLPVAAHAEKSGAFVDWEGRVRPFAQALDTGFVSDHRALHMLADEMGEFLGCRTVTEIRSEMERLGPGSGARIAAPSVEAGEVPSAEDGHLVLATWRHLLDRGILQDGEPFLAGTAPKAAAKVSATTAASLGVVEGDAVTVNAGTSTVTVPVTVTEMADHVVWLPTNSAGCDLRGTLADAPGIRVSVTKLDKVDSK
jgi:NADH-quinone oxidoreductase subunit G